MFSSRRMIGCNICRQRRQHIIQQQYIHNINNNSNTHTNTNIMISRRTLVFSAKNTNANAPKNNPDFRPRRIILLRHGQSLGNVDESAYVTTGERYFLYSISVTKKKVTRVKY